MPVYKYKAISEKGKHFEGAIDAESPKAATEKLKRQNIFLSSMREVKKGKTRRLFIFKGISTAELAVTTRQFSTLISAGFPLEASLVALSEQTEDARMSQVLTQVRDRINEGSSLASALKEHPNVFSDLYVNIVKAGEASGTLDIVLLRLSDFLEKQMALRSRVRSALIYPIFMSFIGGGVLFFMMTYVIPRIARIFEDSRRALPLITVVLIEISKFLSQNIVILFLLFNGVREKVREGTSLAGPLRESGVFPPLVTRMITVGEQTGELEEMLAKIADIYDLQVETSVSTLTSLLEPVMILVVGAVIGFIVFAILLPIFDLTSTIGR